MEQKNIPKETKEALEELEELEELEKGPETNEIIICPSCNEEQLKIIIVSICEAKDSIWYKCSKTKNCRLFQNKLNK
jgi:hypothetical protein